MLFRSGTVGVRRVHTFEPVTVRDLRIRLTGEAGTPIAAAPDTAALRAVTGFHTGHPEIPTPD